MSVVEIVSIPRSEKPILERDMQDYIAEFLPYDPAIPREPPYIYPVLDAYWWNAGHWPFWAKVDGAIAGFALLRAADGVTEMAEFYVRPAFRRNGLGLTFARMLIARFPGRWTVSQYQAKTDAVAFWHRVLDGRAFTERDYLSANGNARVEQAFEV